MYTFASRWCQYTEIVCGGYVDYAIMGRTSVDRQLWNLNWKFREDWSLHINDYHCNVSTYMRYFQSASCHPDSRFNFSIPLYAAFRSNEWLTIFHLHFAYSFQHPNQAFSSKRLAAIDHYCCASMLLRRLWSMEREKNLFHFPIFAAPTSFIFDVPCYVSFVLLLLQHT